MGDHAWIHIDLNVADRRAPRQRTVWRCVNAHSFREDVLASLPEDFEAARHFESFVAGKMNDHRAKLRAKECRRRWEPFAIKVLRKRIQECEDAPTKVALTQRLFKERVAWAKNGDLVSSAKELQTPLFPLS